MPDPTILRTAQAAPWPDPPDEAAYHGLAGEIVRELLPHTEADPVGLLVTFLACVGNAIGPGPHYRVGGARHELRLFPVLVGATSSGRKGTAVDTLSPIFEAALPDWWARRTKGLVSGEGLIYHVRDATTERVKRKNMGVTIGHEDVVSDAGAVDKRLLVVEKEFGGVLRVMTREGNTLSAVIRDAWDGGPMATLAKNSATRATGAHITILGHITPEELTALLTASEADNGFANRFLWICVTRSKLLPFGGELDDDTILGIGEVLRAAIEDATTVGRLALTEEARGAWAQVYGPITTGEPGLVGVLLGRGAPYVMRMAGVYAALDGVAAIDLPHLRAALALWGYGDASVRHVFGATPKNAANPYRATILAALGGGSLTLTEIGDDVLGKNGRGGEPLATLDGLVAEGLVTRTVERPASGRGRPTTRFALASRPVEGEVRG
jgi:hypothetical protein